MRLTRLTPLLLLTAIGCSSEKEAATTELWEPFAGALADTQRRSLTSEITGRKYQISVALPENYSTSNESYPVLYAVDANGEFGTVVEAARLLRLDELVPELIIVGIGYPVGRYSNARELRRVDLRPAEDPTEDSSENSDGATRFLDFIRRELIPLVELEFRANPTGRAFYGHSLGGQFALFALFEGEGTFERVIAGSPGIRKLFQRESAYAKSYDSLPAKLFLSSGILEDGRVVNVRYGNRLSDVKEFVATLESRNHKGLQIKTAYFEDETHVSVIPATISRGLRVIYEDFPGVVSQ